MIDLSGKAFVFGTLFGLFLAGCVSANFAYRWYYLEPVSYDGKLLGPSPDKDIDLSVCKKDSKGAHSCVVMLKDEFKAVYLDYLDLQNRLAECQKGKQ